MDTKPTTSPRKPTAQASSCRCSRSAHLRQGGPRPCSHLLSGWVSHGGGVHTGWLTRAGLTGYLTGAGLTGAGLRGLPHRGGAQGLAQGGGAQP